MDQGPIVSTHGLSAAGLTNIKTAWWNLSPSALYEFAVRRGEASMSAGGALVCLTGEYTGRSPKDKFIVRDAATEDTVWWGDINQPISTEAFDALHRRITSYLQGREIFVQDLHAGALPEHRLNVRIVTENAWHNLFARNMFLRPPLAERYDFAPDFTVIQAPGFQAIPEIDGTRSPVFIIVNFERRLCIIGGTHYAGEIKKSVFGVLNYLLPEKGVLPMHCSANVDGDHGDGAVFFGVVRYR